VNGHGLQCFGSDKQKNIFCVHSFIWLRSEKNGAREILEAGPSGEGGKLTEERKGECLFEPTRSILELSDLPYNGLPDFTR